MRGCAWSEGRRIVSAANSPKYRFRPLVVKSLLPFIALFALAGAVPTVPAAESVFRPDDVIALVGGEDMAAIAEQGRLEWLAVRTLPDRRHGVPAGARSELSVA